MKVIEVAAGLIHRDGRYLIARRKPGGHLAGFWEFPGGKREPGESLTDCLQRELFEELSIRVDLVIPYRTIRHDYLDRIIELHFFRCGIGEGEPTPIGCEEIRWVYPEDFTRFKFPPADYPVIEALRRDALGVSR